MIVSGGYAELRERLLCVTLTFAESLAWRRGCWRAEVLEAVEPFCCEGAQVGQLAEVRRAGETAQLGEEAFAAGRDGRIREDGVGVHALEHARCRFAKLFLAEPCVGLSGCEIGEAPFVKRVEHARV